MEREITIDDVIAFIIKHCDDRAMMDKINKTSFPFTTKYLSKNEVILPKYYDNDKYTWAKGEDDNLIKC